MPVIPVLLCFMLMFRLLYQIRFCVLFYITIKEEECCNTKLDKMKPQFCEKTFDLCFENTRMFHSHIEVARNETKKWQRTISSIPTHTHTHAVLCYPRGNKARTFGMEGAGLPSNEPVDVQTMLMSSKWLVVPDWGSAECNNVTGVFLKCRLRNSPQTGCQTEWNRARDKVPTVLIHRNTVLTTVFVTLRFKERDCSAHWLRQMICSPGGKSGYFCNGFRSFMKANKSTSDNVQDDTLKKNPPFYPKLQFACI